MDCGAEFTADLAEAEVIVVNTCGFIDAAKKESIDALVEAGRLKEAGSCRAVVGVGCMVQRHKDELVEALPEVDLFLGAAEVERLIPKLLELMAREPRIVPYIDMPIQHASDDVLKRMRRPERRQIIRERVARIRAVVPDVAIRTTCIVGFPGETDADFECLLKFLEEIQFERVGAFTYSPQEGTHAVTMADDVPEAVKGERLEWLVELQRLVTAERYEQRVGRIARALVDRVETAGVLQARTLWQADDIDGVTRLTGDPGVEPGSLVDVAIESVVDDYDFQATLVRVVSTPAPKRARLRSLPVLATSMGSYGR